MKNTQTFIEQNKDKFLNQLFELLRIPSISADSAYAPRLGEAAEKIAHFLKQAGAENIQILQTPGFPIVFGEKIIDPQLPTVLVYGHYDVQPVVPLELWENPPFEPIIKKTDLHPQGAIFARGATDDKGQMFMHIAAFEAMVKTGELPCNIKFMIEGEEEVGSEHLKDMLKKHQALFACDVILISDTSIIANTIPSICVALRGIAAAEVWVEGPSRDLHSGIYGGAVANPIEILCKMIHQLKDQNNQITIPNFYQQVVKDSKVEKIPFDEKQFLGEIGVDIPYGEKGFSVLEQVSERPTLELNGIFGGYQGEGSKTVIPSTAGAKITMRIVADQDPEKILEDFCNYFPTLAPKGVKVKVISGHTGKAYLLKTDHPAYFAAEKAMEKTFGKKPLAKKEGGSIPITALFEEILKAKSVLLGFGLDSDCLHAPNEHFGLFNFYKGIETIPYFYHFYTEQYKNKKGL